MSGSRYTPIIVSFRGPFAKQVCFRHLSRPCFFQGFTFAKVTQVNPPIKSLHGGFGRCSCHLCDWNPGRAHRIPQTYQGVLKNLHTQTFRGAAGIYLHLPPKLPSLVGKYGHFHWMYGIFSHHQPEESAATRISVVTGGSLGDPIPRAAASKKTEWNPTPPGKQRKVASLKLT